MAEPKREKLARFFEDLIEQTPEDSPDLFKYEGIKESLESCTSDKEDLVQQAWEKLSPRMATAPGNRYDV
jgi:hypothetical protein